ncbi:MAG TPA: hypothetical protein VHD90_02055 [Phototrophicaceae bacterium]|nr:hypothetical protein [Phototrophicaceae bacterium]
MPVLLLARGDQPSRTLLRRAIEARYGLGAPALETCKLEVKGRARAKIGPVATWVTLEGTSYLKFPFLLRWNFSMRPAGVAITSSALAFDGEVARRRDGKDRVTVVEGAAEAVSMRARLWAVCAALLTPLTEHYVELKTIDARSFEARHTEAKIAARLHLHDDDTLDFTATECLNPASGTQETFTLQLSDGQTMFGDLMMPRKIAVLWGDQAEIEIAPVKAECNIPLDDSLFRLESD